MPSIGKNLQPFTGNGDISIWVNNSRVGRKTTNKQTKNFYEINIIKTLDLCVNKGFYRKYGSDWTEIWVFYLVYSWLACFGPLLGPKHNTPQDEISPISRLSGVWMATEWWLKGHGMAPLSFHGMLAVRPVPIGA